MEIVYTKTIAKGQISIDVEAQNFTDNEKAAFEAFGDPIVVYKQECGSGQLISLKKHIYTELKFTQTFNTDPLQKDTIKQTVEDASIFMEHFKITIEQLMQTLMKNYADLQDKFATGTVTVSIND